MHCQVTAYSTQSDKVINSGEGGFVTTSDDEIAARAIFLAGAYERRYCEIPHGWTPYATSFFLPRLIRVIGNALGNDGNAAEPRYSCRRIAICLVAL